MKILQVVSYFYPAWAYGGPSRTAYELSKELVKRGHEVTVYTTDSLDAQRRVDFPSGKVIELDGIKVYYLRNLSNWLAGRHHLFLTPSIIKSAHDNLREFDIIHLHEYRSIINIPVYHYARRYGVPYVLHAQGSIPKFATKRVLKTIYDALWERGLLEYATRVIAMTHMEAEQYRSVGVSEDKIEIIPSGVDLSEFEDLPQRGNFRRRYGLNKDEKLVLYLGRIHQSKGIDLLVKAFGSLSKRLDGVKLAIVGPDDGYLSKLMNLIKDLQINRDSVLFTGPLYGRDKLNSYIDADVFVNPRAEEPFGLVLLEACACGVPVICSKGCGLADTLNGQGGVAIPYDEEQLEETLRHMLSNDQMRHDFGRRGKSLVREQFNWSTIAGQVENVYLSCLSP